MKKHLFSVFDNITDMSMIANIRMQKAEEEHDDHVVLPDIKNHSHSTIQTLAQFTKITQNEIDFRTIKFTHDNFHL